MYVSLPRASQCMCGRRTGQVRTSSTYQPLIVPWFQNKNETFSCRKGGDRHLQQREQGIQCVEMQESRRASRKQQLSFPGGCSPGPAATAFSLSACSPQHRTSYTWRVPLKCPGQPFTRPTYHAKWLRSDAEPQINSQREVLKMN